MEKTNLKKLKIKNIKRIKGIVTKLFITATLLFVGVINLAAQSSFTVELGTTSIYQIDKQTNITEYIWQVYTDYNLTTHASPEAVMLTSLGAGRENEIEVTWNSVGTYYLSVFVIGDDGCLNKMGFEFNVISNESIIAIDDSISLLTCDTELILILENDIYIQDVSVSIIDEPDFGTFILNEDGTISYTSNCDYIGNDTLTYEITNDSGSDTAIVIITIQSFLTYNANTDCVDEVPYYSWELSVLGITLSNIDITIYDADGTLIELIEDAPFSGSNVWPGYDSNFEIYPYGISDLLKTIHLEVDYNSEYFENEIDTLTLPNCDINIVVAVWDTVSVYGEEIIIDVLSNDYDPDEGDIDTTSVDIVTWFDGFNGPYHGDVVVNNDGTITYIPDLGYSGLDSFIYVICDDYTPNIACDTAIVILELFSNEELIAVDDYYNLNVGETGEFEISENDFDPEGQLDLTSIVIIADPENGNVITNGDGTVTYQPLPDFEGIDSFQYVICDLGIPQDCDDAWVYINIVANSCVEANNDTVYTYVMEEVNIPVLDNDFDFENEIDPSTLIILSSAEHGNVYLQQDYTISYIPNEIYVGIDSFTYRICDLGYPVCCSSAKVYVHLVDINEGMEAVFDTISTFQNEEVAIDILENDYDTDGYIDSSTVVIIDFPDNGTVVINDDGSLIYTPDENYSGLDSLIYNVCDNGPIVTCDTAIVYIEIIPLADLPPVAVNDTLYADSGTENEYIISINDYDPEGFLDSLSITIITPPTSGTLSFDIITGLITYIPGECMYAIDSFTYVIYDMGGLVSNIATVYLNVSIDPALDSDNDGVPDLVEDVDGNGNPCDDDSDGDDIPDYQDTDDDNDCVLTIDEDFNNNGDFYDDDMDNDGIVDFLDDDHDGDGIWGCDENQDLDDNGILDANEDWHSGAEDDVVTIGLDTEIIIPVLDNDSITMNDSTIYVIVDPIWGYVDIDEGDWTIEYRPDIDFVGVDSFIYVVCDYYDNCDTATVTIYVEDLITPPHLFTPNDDGQNDYYRIDGLDRYPDNQFVVYNRWGNKVYEYSGYYDEWNGYANVKNVIGSEKLPVGVYYYILNYGVNRKKAGALFLER